METQTLITLDVLTSKGISTALDICNEIESRMSELTSLQTDKVKLTKLFQIVCEHVPMHFEHSYQKTTKTKYEPVRTTRKAIMSQSRIRELVECRCIMYTLLRLHTGLSLKSIGAEFSGRDHSSVCHGLNLCDDLLKTDKRFRALYESIEKEFTKFLK